MIYCHPVTLLILVFQLLLSEVETHDATFAIETVLDCLENHSCTGRPALARRGRNSMEAKANEKQGKILYLSLH